MVERNLTAESGAAGHSNRLSKIFLILGTLGIADACYSAYENLTQSFSSCDVNSKISCGGVYASGHTSIFGIPFFVMGLVWFPLLVFLGLLATKSGKTALTHIEILLPILMIGNLFTIFLWYLELFVIGIICPVCVSLYFINYAMTAVAIRSMT